MALLTGDTTGPPLVVVPLITEWTGLPVSVRISGADVHDGQALIPLVKGIPPIRSRRGPRRRKPGILDAYKGYDHRHLRQRPSGRGIRHRIARKASRPHSASAAAP
ncbi:hypothetical protein [Streptomyces sp. NBC_00414]|uniref:hypothetical protein n=1 Tax=Streptomyces sp. NBC_00414 TaxID=2975739 RepID=UPI003FA6BD9A